MATYQVAYRPTGSAFESYERCVDDCVVCGHCLQPLGRQPAYCAVCHVAMHPRSRSLDCFYSVIGYCSDCYTETVQGD